MRYTAKELVRNKEGDGQRTFASVQQFLHLGVFTVRIIEMFTHAQCVDHT
jgi:hypothetical protein